MTNRAQKATYGYVCPVKGCPKQKNRRFTYGGLFQHMRACHGEQEAIKRLKVKRGYRLSRG